MKKFLIFMSVGLAFIARPVNAEVIGKTNVAFKNAIVADVHMMPLPYKKSLISNTDVAMAPAYYTELYNKAGLDIAGLSFEAFTAAYKGYEKLQQHGYVDNEKLAICDFTKASGERRLYIINPNTQKLLLRTYVAHGKNSGGTYANSFGNEMESNKSSLGFYITGSTYQGANGYSLYLKGMDAGFNDNAYNRSVVMHGADYVSQSVAEDQGFVGRSFGCPAVAKEVHEKVINMLKSGSCLFIYYPSKQYLKKSKWLR
jgi:hypothetical protein